MRRLAGQTGQTAAEYMGLLFVVSVMIAAIASAGIDVRIASAIRTQICKIAGGSCEVGASRASASKDSDLDGVSDAVERAKGLNPRRADSDGDGLSDATEMNPVVGLAVGGLDPRKADSDGDGVPDRTQLINAGLAACSMASRRSAG